MGWKAEFLMRGGGSAVVCGVTLLKEIIAFYAPVSYVFAIFDENRLTSEFFIF